MRRDAERHLFSLMVWHCLELYNVKATRLKARSRLKVCGATGAYGHGGVLRSSSARLSEAYSRSPEDNVFHLSAA